MPARPRTRPARTRSVRRRVAAGAVAAAALASCGEDAADDARVPSPAGEVQVHPGELHACAGDLPVPEAMTVVETRRGRDRAGEPTCVVSVRAERPVGDATGLYLAALDAAGWSHQVEQEGEASTVVQLRGPRCGAVVLLGDDGTTSVLATIVDCDDAAGPG